MVMVRSIIIPWISKRWSNPHMILDRKDSNTSRQNTTLAGEHVVFIRWTSLRWKEVKGVVDDNKNHRGQGWYFSSWIQLISWMSSECWWSQHLCRESSWRCNRSATTSSQSNDEVKGYRNQGYDTTRNQACCSRRNGMTMRIDVRLVHRRKLVLRE